MWAQRAGTRKPYVGSGKRRVFAGRRASSGFSSGRHGSSAARRIIPEGGNGPAAPTCALLAAMSDLTQLFANNRAWAAKIEAQEPGFFANLAKQQSPQYLWIG